MTLSRRIAALATVATVLGVAAAVPASAAAQATEPVRAFSTTTLQFTVQVGPADARRTCTVVGDLRVPAGVTAATPALGAILATNGFGGGKDDTGPNGNGSYAARFAEQGYVTLSYSGLGFGGSSCNIYVDDPEYDGQAGSQLVSFLGGARGIASKDGSPVDIAGLVRLDRRGSDGKAMPGLRRRRRGRARRAARAGLGGPTIAVSAVMSVDKVARRDRFATSAGMRCGEASGPAVSSRSAHVPTGPVSSRAAATTGASTTTVNRGPRRDGPAGDRC